MILRRTIPLLLAGGLIVGLPSGSPSGQAQEKPADRVDFNRDVRPILSDNCYTCHGFDKNKRKSGLRLDQKEGAFEKLESGDAAVVAGQPDASALYRRISTKDPDDLMPPPDSGKKLSDAQVRTLRRWIEEGAEWKPHWAYIPPVRPSVPGPGNAVDAFIRARLAKEGLAPSPEADPVTLLRRLSFDLTGLPPAIAEVDAFAADPSPANYEKQIDRLLASPHYGERMAMHWLDLVRFADTRGFHSDNPRNVAPYRDYVIRSFNENKRFDQFTIDQLAGDLLPDPTLQQRIATAYNRLNLTTEEGGAQPKEYAAKTAADRVRNASSVWMAATLGCAECHDHKFDPYSARDFYGFAAFFADVREPAIRDYDLGIPLPTDAEAARLRELDGEIARLRKTLDASTPELEAAQAEWERHPVVPREIEWHVLDPIHAYSQEASALAREPDLSILASGARPKADTYNFNALLTLKGVTAFRIEALPHPSLPAGGPGRAEDGGFVLTGIYLEAAPLPDDHFKKVSFRKATATNDPEGGTIAKLFDDVSDARNTGWSVVDPKGRENALILETESDVGKDKGMLLRISFHQRAGDGKTLGRFRLSATTDPRPIRAVPGAELPKAVSAILAVEAAQRTDEQRAQLARYYRTLAPLLHPVRERLRVAERRRAEQEAAIAKCLVTTSGRPRTTRLLPRGNWMDESGEEVPPAVPSFLASEPAGKERATRMDLARWLVSPKNPLTARVFVNRLWKLFFGLGISKSLDDLGAQGEVPVHPELLDWLAVEFMESGWDVKHLVKLIVQSSTYRQTSLASPDLRERDPYNRLLARQSRYRLDAEMVRDNALAVSGLLSRKIGGPSVKPYQPRGYWEWLNFPRREWAPDAGEDGRRRGLYTFWQRTFPHPSLVAFDAPGREECTAERSRSNIPQQALALLNDPTYVEAARALACRILEEGGATPAERIRWVFRQALSRNPKDAEAKVLGDLYRKHLAAGGPEAEGDAWTSVARTVLNLHETITRN